MRTPTPRPAPLLLTLFAGCLLVLGCIDQRAVLTKGEARTAGRNDAPARYHAELTTSPKQLQAGEPAELVFQVKDPGGNDVRFLQFVHERPLHLLVLSEDLGDFDHIHPQQVVGTSYNVTHTFPHGGQYRLYADFTPPGSGTIVEQFTLNVGGAVPPPRRLIPDKTLTKAGNGLRATLVFDKPLRAGEDLQFTCALADAETGRPVTDLQLYLGALAHFVIISEDKASFIHAHPLDAGEVYDPSQDPAAHFHDPKELAKRLIGPSPSEVTAVTSFPHGGRYKLWAQFQRADRAITIPFVLDVANGERRAKKQPVIPTDAIKVTVSASGYEPAHLEVVQGRPVKLAFYRPDSNNCGGTVLFPKLNLKYTLPAGEVVLVEFTPKETGELTFLCGMGMLRGLLVIK